MIENGIIGDIVYIHDIDYFGKFMIVDMFSHLGLKKYVVVSFAKNHTIQLTVDFMILHREPEKKQELKLQRVDRFQDGCYYIITGKFNEFVSFQKMVFVNHQELNEKSRLFDFDTGTFKPLKDYGSIENIYLIDTFQVSKDRI